MKSNGHVPRSHNRLSAPAESLGGHSKREGVVILGLKCGEPRFGAATGVMPAAQRLERAPNALRTPTKGTPTNIEYEVEVGTARPRCTRYCIRPNHLHRLLYPPIKNQ